MTNTTVFPLLAVLVLAGARAQHPATGFAFDTVRELARAASAHEFRPAPVDDLPQWLADLDYDRYRRIRFRGATALWRGMDVPFEVQFAHRGYLFRRPVAIHEVVGGEVRPLTFEPQQFEYALEPAGEVPPGLGYAGFNLRYPLDHDGVPREVASFLGASYFRLLGRGQHWGASARGLAIGTASPRGEEFPEFVSFWIVRPESGAEHIEVFALLDSPSVAGACRFVVRPGQPTRADVTLALFPRRPIEKLGIAPVTSMFLHGEQRLHRLSDFRPEVHDSDGLAVEERDGRFLWRPLVNPTGKHRVTRLAAESPKGFGLLQRDRSFRNYQDLESRFELRPSLWVTPANDWGRGAVELVEIPSEAEGNDNVTAYWVPEQPAEPGRELVLRYTLTAQLADVGPPALGRVRATRTTVRDGSDLFVLDWDGLSLDDAGTLAADVAASGLEVRHVVLQQNPVLGGVRLAFELVGAGASPVEVRVTLRRGQERVSETWVEHWQKP